MNGLLKLLTIVYIGIFLKETKYIGVGDIIKNKKCIKCGIRIHYTDWIILKELSLLPICDN
jgi:hypothetical protein